MSPDDEVGSAKFAERAAERAERAPEPSGEYARRHREARIEQTQKTADLARASEAAERRKR